MQFLPMCSKESLRRDPGMASMQRTKFGSIAQTTYIWHDDKVSPDQLEQGVFWRLRRVGFSISILRAHLKVLQMLRGTLSMAIH